MFGGDVWASWLVRLVDFRERTSENVTRCPRSEWWTGLVSAARKALVVLPKPIYTLERSKAWLQKSIMPTASAVLAGLGGDMESVI